jgi:cell division protein FtsW (lipid II flippase)
MLAFFRRITGRLLEQELLITAALLVGVSMGLVVLGAHSDLGLETLYRYRYEGAIAAGLLALLLLVSVALALRNWGEDQLLLPIVALLAGVGLLMAYRLGDDVAMRYGGVYSNIALKQSVWVMLGIGVLAAINFVPWRMRWLKHYRYSWLLFGLILVAATLFVGVGRDEDTRLWLELWGFQLQPVELLKILLVVYLATYLDDHGDLIGADYYIWGIRLPPLPYLLPLLLMWGLTSGLIVYQRDLGAALLFFTIFLAMLYMLTGQAGYVAAGLGAFTFAAAMLYPFFVHVRDRVDAWYNPWVDPLGRGYQMIQAMYALAHGGYIGQGLGLGDPTTIPESHTDFVFVAIGEELGMVGALALLLCYVLLAFRGYQIALRTRDGFQQLLAAGLTTAIAAQALIITAGTTNLVPLTGITLPFVSYGGSSILVNFAMIGLLLRISATNKSPYVL